MVRSGFARSGVGVLFLAAALAACSDSPSPTAVSGTPAKVMAVGGATASAYVGSPVATVPTVKVTDAGGRGIPGVQVTFAVSEGGGSVQTASTATNSQGVASAGTWTLGPSTGENAVDATAAGLPSVRFTATAVSPFEIDVQVLGNPTPAQQAALDGAVATWRSVILSQLSPAPLSARANSCFSGQPQINQTVNGLLLFVQFTTIDGVGKTLAESGPCYVRSGNSLPIMGSLTLDVADLPSLEAAGQLQDVITHEMAHILGFGTIWTDHQLLSGAGSSNPLFLGTGAIGSYLQLGAAGSGVPVENTGGLGTRDSHWRETVFGNELMTGYLNRGANPLSVLTVAAMNDLGYVTDPSKAQPYTLPSGAGISGDLVPVDMEQHEVLLSPRYTVDVPAAH